MIKEKAKNLPLLFSGAFISALLMLAVYALKGVWQFGAVDITYDDMAQGTLPVYYHLYDWLHGEKAMAFDWYTGLGTNIVNSGTFMPLDLVLCLFSRDKLLYGIGILIIVKVAASAVTATLTTVFIGALSDKIGKRKLFMCAGYILWGISILCFILVREDVINALFE